MTLVACETCLGLGGFNELRCYVCVNIFSWILRKCGVVCVLEIILWRFRAGNAGREGRAHLERVTRNLRYHRELVAER